MGPEPTEQPGPTNTGKDIRDMLRGLRSIPGAQVPATITAAFITADQLLEQHDRACAYEQTPLGFMNPDRGMDEFPESDESLEAQNELLAFLGRHPELAGTREFGSWFARGRIGSNRDGC